MTNFTIENINDIFSNHQLTSEQLTTYVKINRGFLDLALNLIPLLPDGPGKTAAVRHLADSRMKFNAALALDGKF